MSNNMKQVKIKICDHNPNNPNSYGHFLITRLKQFYDVELSEEPDYVFFHQATTEYLNYPEAIKIFYTGENIHPNFNLCDYAISFDYLSFNDRHFRLPLYILAIFYNQKDFDNAEDLDFENISPMDQAELNRKTDFCSFVYSNYLADPKREQLFYNLSKYKKVNSGGKYLNNVGGPVDSKLLFEKQHKFSIAFENSSRAGYTTEKLPAAIAARTIPIYFGNPLIGKEFNIKRIINVHDFKDTKSLIDRIREIDENDKEYLEIINQPVLAKNYHFEEVRKEFDKFLRQIFDQPKADARRIQINSMLERELIEKELLFNYKQRRQSAMHKYMTPFFRLLQMLPGVRSLKTYAMKNRVR